MGTDRRETTNVAVVTGGANGIGEATARRFARLGFTVVIADLADDADDVASTLPDAGEGHAIPVDVSDEDGVDDLFTAVSREFGRVDVLVNNAGIFQTAEPTTEQSIEEWQRVIDVHLRGTYLCSKFAAPLLLECDSAAVVNVSSVAGLRAFPFRTAYGPAKAAINNLTRVLAVEWAESGVRVNAVAPGYVRTNPRDERVPKVDFDPDRIRDRTPMGEFGDPDDVARAVEFLASDRSRYVTGVTLPVDGGWSAYGHV